MDWDQKTSSLETETPAEKGAAVAPEAGRATKRSKKAEAAAEPTAAAVGEPVKRKAAAEPFAPAAGEPAKRKELAAREQAKPKAKAKAGDKGVVPEPPSEMLAVDMAVLAELPPEIQEGSPPARTLVRRRL